ncbi:MAG: hypothetical protein CMJ39_00755 [Phycisphaerae bacterium]|nr:hypothetical protein [Phycisphaerae bacterium]|tara:strand:- start:116 stop:637 length:522 start_codon:yes stop_codon:yes gene_type:complete
MDPKTLAHTVTYTEGLLTRFLDGFDDESRTSQAPGLPNHAIWLLGHCGFSMNRVAAEFDGEPVNGAFYLDGDGTGGDSARFDITSIRIGSTPASDPTLYPTLDRGLDCFKAAIQRLSTAAANQSSEWLDQELVMHGTRLTRGEQVIRLCFHNGYHAGQLGDLRRALGMPRVIG